ncbi:hypothetical protein V866_005754 [Kwoniella sp. B9012]|uniref:Uncharacterized protein n=1 Tax=Kwoniella europaea PYCC6329 TaxID=1423913 RepID=A0AAX4KQ95_9TREE
MTTTPPTFRNFIAIRLPEDHPIAEEEARVILRDTADNEGNLQQKFGGWITQIIVPRWELEAKHTIECRYGGSPNLSSVRVRKEERGEVRDITYSETRFHKDIVRWESQARIRQGKSGEVSSTYGAKAPDGLIYAQTFVSAENLTKATRDPLLPPTVATWADVVASGRAPSSRITRAVPSNIVPLTPLTSPDSLTMLGSRTRPPPPAGPDQAAPILGKGKKPEQIPVSVEGEKGGKRTKASSATSLELKHGSPGEKAYVVPSMTTELKPISTPLEKVVCQGLAYLIGCNECCGTYLGLLIRGHTYALVYAITESTFAIKSATPDAPRIYESLTVEEYLAVTKDLPSLLGTLAQPNIEGFKEIWSASSKALDLIVDFPLRLPLPPLSPPDSPVINALRHVTMKEMDSESTRRFIAGIIRPNTKVEGSSRGRGGKKGRGGGRGGGRAGGQGGQGREAKRESGGEAGGEPGAGAGGESSGGAGDGGSSAGQATGPPGGSRSLAQPADVSGGIGFKARGLSQRATGSSSGSSGNLTSSTSSRSSEQRPAPPITPQEANIIPSATSRSSDSSKLLVRGSSSLVTSAPQPLATTLEEVEETLPSGFRESDFPRELSEIYPEDPEDDELSDEERERREERDMLYLAQKATLRKRGVKLIQLPPSVFDALIAEIGVRA